jgi:hypothetical protein
VVVLEEHEEEFKKAKASSPPATWSNRLPDLLLPTELMTNTSNLQSLRYALV